ncbi:M23 family metallopeptidase [Staphylococcus auricularis]|uniref:M23 family metallopeptidase n=1 Tax=Staphylococcus auricularis TaxID=29379 RepID=UPI00073FB6ED
MVKRAIKILLICGVILIPAILIFTNMERIQSWFNDIKTTVASSDQSEDDYDWDDLFDGSRETETFGEYEYADFDGKHYGIDYALPRKTPIKAAADGIVTRTFKDKLGGNVLQIAEDDGKHYEWYMHLSEYKVETGDEVKRGDVVALSGNTGEQTTGPHLHFQRMKGGVGNKYAEDPADFVDQLPDGEKSLYDLEK